MSETAIRFVEEVETPAIASKRKRKDPNRNLWNRDGWWYVVVEYKGKVSRLFE